MPRVEFARQSARDDDYRAGNSMRLVNLFGEVMQPGGKTQVVLKGVPRTNAFAQLPQIFLRDMRQIDGKFYAMGGGTLYRVLESGSVSALGDTVSADGAMIFGAELGKVCTVSGGRYFVWDGSTMSEPTAGAFSDFGSGVFIGGYVVLTEDGGRRFQWSDLADAETLPALNFATAESTDTDILRAVSLQGRLLLMKEDAIEQWAPTGAAGANAFSLIPGGVIETGLKARNLVARFTGGVFFVGDDDIAYISNGGQTQPVSGPAVNTSLAQADPTHCFAYEEEGHIFCVVRFSDRPAWVYDISTGLWHERASGDEDPWACRVAAKAFGNWYAGDVFGKIYRLSRTGTDEGGNLIRTAVSSTLYMDGDPFRVPELQITARMGQGADLMMWTSRDGGLTFGRERTRSLGNVGAYGARCIFRGLGWFEEQACFKISLSDPQDIAIDASCNVRVA